MNTKPIGRPVGSIAIHPYEELVILERILQTPATTLAEIVEEVNFTLKKVYENKHFSEVSRPTN